MSTIAIGCGSPLWGDDAVGLHAVRALARRRLPEGVTVLEAGTPGPGLLDLLAGADRALLLDAVVSGAPVGTIHRLTEADLPAPEPRRLSLHDMAVSEAIALGRLLEPETMPAEIIILGIEVPPPTLGRSGLHPAVAAALPALLAAVERELLSSAGRIAVSLPTDNR